MSTGMSDPPSGQASVNHSPDYTYTQRMALIGELWEPLLQDVRQPLTAINAYVGALSQLLGGQTQDRQVEAILEKITGQINRANGLIGEMRGFAEREFSFATTDLNHLIRRALSLAEHRIQTRDIEQRRQLTRSRIPVRCDAAKIEQVIAYLILTVVEQIERAPCGGRRLIKLSTTRPSQGRVQLTIVGTHRLSEASPPSFEAPVPKNAAEFCQCIIDAHDGQLWMQRTSVGTAWFLNLPVAELKD